MWMGPQMPLHPLPQCMQACRFEREPGILNTSPSFRMRDCRFRTWLHHFELNPIVYCCERESVILNANPILFRMQACHFEHKPNRFRTRPHYFDHKPVVSNVSPPFRTRPHCFECEPIVSDTTPFFSSTATISNASPCGLAQRRRPLIACVYTVTPTIPGDVTTS